MKRISFKDSGGLNLTQAVLTGSKTMTRRIAYMGEITNLNTGFFTEGKNKDRLALCDSNFVVAKSQYSNGEVVAIQQSYKDLDEEVDLYKFLHMDNIHERFSEECKTNKGWTNKMFVKAELMHHHIQITNIRVERLQDISDKDCLREGVSIVTDMHDLTNYCFGESDEYYTPRKAFAALIDKVSGRGTFDSNPLVWVYSFERVD